MAVDPTLPLGPVVRLQVGHLSSVGFEPPPACPAPSDKLLWSSPIASSHQRRSRPPPATLRLEPSCARSSHRPRRSQLSVSACSPSSWSSSAQEEETENSRLKPWLKSCGDLPCSQPSAGLKPGRPWAPSPALAPRSRGPVGCCNSAPAQTAAYCSTASRSEVRSCGPPNLRPPSLRYNTVFHQEELPTGAERHPFQP